MFLKISVRGKCPLRHPFVAGLVQSISSETEFPPIPVVLLRTQPQTMAVLRGRTV